MVDSSNVYQEDTMFWTYVTVGLILIFGLVNIIWPHKTAEFTWAVRHDIDDEGRKSMEHAMRFMGIIFALGSLIWIWDHIAQASQ